MDRNTILARMSALVDGAATETRSLSAEEVTEYEQLEADLEALNKTEEIAKRNALYTKPVNVILKPDGNDGVSEEFRAFHHWMITGQENTELRALTTAVDAAGGYLVPDSTSTKIVARLKSFGGLAPESTSINTTTGEPMLWATEDDTAATSEIVAEGAAPASAGLDKVLGQASLSVFKYEASGASHLPMKVSWEFLQDAPINVEDWIANNFAIRIARKYSVDICVGAGTTLPLGIVTPKTAFAEIAANSTGPTYSELVSAVAALDPAYESNAKWLMNPTVWWNMVSGLKDTTGRPLIQAQAESGAGSAIARQLLGYPVVLDTGMPVLGDQSKSIVFGDLRQSYVTRQAGGFHLQRFNELYAVNGFVGFLGWARKGGTVQNANSYVLLGGQNTV